MNNLASTENASSSHTCLDIYIQYVAVLAINTELNDKQKSTKNY